MKKQVIAAIVATLMLLTGLAQANAVQDSAQVFEQFSGKKIGVQTGTISGEVAQSVIPDIELSYYNSQTDALTAVRLGKIDAWATDEPIARFMIIENTDLQVIPERLDESSLAAVFAKDAEGEALCRQYSAFVDQLWADGTMEEIDSIWFGTDDTRRTVLDYKALPDTNGTLRMALDASILPFAYVKDDRVVGYDVDIAARFCQANGYRLEVVPMSFDGVLPSVQTGKCNFAACGITVTQERADSMRFSSPTYRSGTVLTVRRSDNESTVLTGAGYTRLDQLDGKMIGVQTGQSFDSMIMERLPNAIISYVNSKADLTNALMTHKIESYAVDEPVIKAQMREIDSLTYIPEYLSTFEFGYVFAKTEEGRALQEQFNEFLRTIKADGTLQEIEDRWLSPDDAQKTLPDYSRFPAPNGTLHMATEALYQPFTYILNGEIVGYDIDIAVRFCEAYGYGLEITDMSFDGILPSVKTGKADFGGAGITITPERAESVLFSEPNYAGGTVMAVLKDGNTSPAPSGVYTSVSQLDGARIGVQTGTTFDEIVLDTLPDALISYFNSYPDMAAALEANKIDGFPGDEPVLRLMASEDSKLTVLNEYMDSFEFGFVLPKTAEGEKLLAEIDAWIESMQASGELGKIISKWTDGPEEDKVLPDYAAFSASNGMLTLATEGAYAPMNYFRADEVVGFEIDLAARFCEANGYGLQVVPMLFDGILPAVQSGKADFAAAGITITEERKESVYFSVPYYSGGTVMAVLKGEETAIAGAENSSFLDGIASSFHKTFVREGRWKLFAEGVLTTLLITLLSVLFGTALGFLLFMLCRNGNAAANALTRFCLWLVQGMPMVVLLMILYYVVFGSVAISGVAVAVIGFTLTFGASVFGLLKMGVGAVDGGQYEAAYALGYTNRRTFFRIILPQALPHVMTAYKGEIVSLIKATAIVGYIAVQDLTKMGDIVRSRTYEAFFPLIAVTVIYFVLEGLLGVLVGSISVHVDPKRRKSTDVLKGVKTDD